MGRRTKLPHEWDQICQEYLTGDISQKTLMRKYGFAVQTFRREMKQRNLPMFPRGSRGRTGPGAPGWQGGTYHKDGYIREWVSEADPMAPMRDSRGYVLQHRLVFARSLGRPLEAYEQVHHIDGNRGNNRLENLQLRIGAHGSGQVFQCQDCGSCNVQPTKLAERI